MQEFLFRLKRDKRPFLVCEIQKFKTLAKCTGGCSAFLVVEFCNFELAMRAGVVSGTR